MKHDYAEQGYPDADDAQLAQAKAKGVVPIGCLKGGQVVMYFAERKEDPCAACSTDRKKCGGRVQTRPPPKGLDLADNDSPGARGMRFQRYLEKLDELWPPEKKK